MAATATVVLVHGAWHGAWCWERVVAGLEARRVPAVAVDLPGHGDDPRPLGDLHDDAASVGAVLDGLEPPVVLVGHSYGGVVVTEAGVHPAVSRLVYLCALVPDAGESAATVAQAFESVDAGPGSRLVDAVRIDDAGLVTVDPAGAAAALYNECDDATAAWAMARLGPQRFVTLEQAPAAVAWRDRPALYVVCGRDRAVPPSLQAELARRCGDTVTWPSDHSPFLSRPADVVDLLAGLAG